MFPNLKELFLNDAATASLLGNPIRVYGKGEAPAGVTNPYVTWQSIASVPEDNLSEITDIDNFSIQVDCFSKTETEVNALGQSVRNALSTVCQNVAVILDSRETETKLYRVAFQANYFLNR
jgi:hypothetical protein